MTKKNKKLVVKLLNELIADGKFLVFINKPKLEVSVEAPAFINGESVEVEVL